MGGDGPLAGSQSDSISISTPDSPSASVSTPDSLNRPGGIYIHWPFCASKCPYCDFNVYLDNKIDADDWLSAYVTALKSYKDIWDCDQIASIYFGGGTPSLMREKDVETIIETAMSLWDPADDIEITLEANPTSSEIDKFEGFRAAGVNRLSLGVQSFEDHWLEFLGRLHNADEVRRGVDVANKVFDRVSYDFIYAMPGQSLTQWEAELRAALPMLKDHVSAYQLTIKPGTAFYQRQSRGDLVLPPDDRAADFYMLTHDILAAAGYPAYEVSNYAHPGSYSRHNMLYWRYNDYLGIGPGAHGRLCKGGQKYATYDFKKPSQWFEYIQQNRFGYEQFSALSSTDYFEEMVMMGLRVSDGVSLPDLNAQTGFKFGDRVPPDRLKTILDEGWLSLQGDHLRPTTEGWLRLDGIVGYLLGAEA